MPGGSISMLSTDGSASAYPDRSSAEMHIFLDLVHRSSSAAFVPTATLEKYDPAMRLHPAPPQPYTSNRSEGWPGLSPKTVCSAHIAALMDKLVIYRFESELVRGSGTATMLHLCEEFIDLFEVESQGGPTRMMDDKTIHRTVWDHWLITAHR